MTKEYSLPKLPYKYDALEPYLSAEILELHHGKHHQAYVNGANATLDSLRDARSGKNFAHINELQKNLAFHLSGHVMHSILWTNMSPDGGGAPKGKLLTQINRHFGDVDALKEQVSKAALGLQGSGWASLAWDTLGRRLVVEQVYDHQGNSGASTLPLLALDMWEHAYYLQYKNQKAKWVDAFWEIVNWPDVAERLEKLT